MPSVSQLERQPSPSGHSSTSTKKPRTMGATAGSSAAAVINSSPGQLRSLLAPYSSSQSPPAHDASLPHSASKRSASSSSRSNSRRPSALPAGVAARDVDAGSSSSDDIDSPKVRRGLDAKGRPMTETGGPRSGMGTGKRTADPNPSVLRDDMGAEADAMGLVMRAGVNEAQAEAGAAAKQAKKDEKVGGLAGGKMASVPVTTRVDPSIIQRIDPEIGLTNAWQLLPFLAGQANTIASSFVSHHLFGPPKKSWGIEMTIFTAIVRSAASFSHLSNIDRLRRMLDLGQILPTPKDGIITPVSFKVKRRNLRGFLRSADRAEDGTREITGEWVVSKRLWKRMQTEHAKRLAAAAAANPGHGGSSETSGTSDRPSVARKNSPFKPAPDASTTAKDDMAAKGPGLGKEKVILYLHGGAYFVMSAATHRPLTISVAKYTECRLFAVNYRLAPETKFPGALHDAVASYFRLIYDLKIPPENIVVAGDSAGGGLSVALLMYLRDEGYPLPCGAILQSPWSDLTMSCDSWDSNLPYDYLPMPKQDDPLNPVKCYLGEEGVRKYITHPYASPLFGDFRGLPPMLVQVGDAEVLRDEVTLLAHKASLHGVQVEHELYEDCVHVFQAFLFLEASRKALQSQRHFIRRTLPQLQADAEAGKERKKAKGLKVKPSPSDESVPTTKPPAIAALQKSAAGGTEESDSDAGATPRRIDSPMPAGRGDGGAVDAEISSDAHLVAEGSRPRPESLPATPRLSTTSLAGAGAAEEEDEEEEEDEPLSTPEAERETTSFGSAVSPPAAAADIASGQRVKAMSAPPQPETAPNATSSPPAPSESSLWSGLSLRGRLPPAMDISTLQSLFMSKSQPGTPAAARASSRRGSVQNMTTAEASSATSAAAGSSSGSAATTPGATHRRSESVGHSLDIYKLPGDDLRPRTIKGRQVGSHPDLKALLDSYNEAAATPGAGLRTTVYRQGDQPDPDEEEYAGYFRNARTTGGKRDAEGEDGTRTPASADGDEEESPQYAFESPGYGFA